MSSVMLKRRLGGSIMMSRLSGGVLRRVGEKGGRRVKMSTRRKGGRIGYTMIAELGLRTCTCGGEKVAK